jgi:hypothetical protein
MILFGQPNFNSIELIYISAPGCSRSISSCGENNEEAGIQNNQIFVLNKNEFAFKKTITGLNIAENHDTIIQSWDEISLTDVTVQPRGKGEIKARREIRVNQEFQSHDSSEVWIHLCRTFIPCDSLSPNFLKKSSFVEHYDREEYENTTEIQLNFAPTWEEFGFKIYPNPGNGIFTADINKLNIAGEIILVVYNQFGEEVFSTIVQNELIQLNLSFLSKGMYFIKISDSEHSKCKKLVII